MQPPSPPALPLTEEQLAAKAVVDEILARQPALAAVKERPDPMLARAAAAKHDAQEKSQAARKTKEAAAEAKRTETGDKSRTRQPAKPVRDKAAETAKSRTAKAPVAAGPARAQIASAAARPVVAPQPLRRMPTPN